MIPACGFLIRSEIIEPLHIRFPPAGSRAKSAKDAEGKTQSAGSSAAAHFLMGHLLWPSMSGKMSDVHTITTRELQQHTKAVRQRVDLGETLQWVMGRRVIGHLVPAAASQPPQPWPDLMGRLRTAYGAGAAETSEASDLIYADRG